ncbi:hypothetical protein AB4182_23130 [Vibrio splendidus]|jgi:hypothetical protein
MNRRLSSFERLLPLLLAIAFIFVFGFMSMWLGEQEISAIFKSIFKDGLPSLVAIVIISVVIEVTVRKRERRSIKDSFNRVFQKQVGFDQYIYPYHDLANGIKTMLSDVDEYNIDKVRMLFIGVDKEGITPVINILNEYGFCDYKLEILTLNPDSELAISRGQALQQKKYSEHISSNLDSIMSYFRDLDNDGCLKQRNVSVKLYNNASKSKIQTLPSVLMIQFGEQFMAFSPVWNNKNVKNGSLCFVPKESSMYTDLVGEYDGIEQLSSEYVENSECLVEEYG